MQHPDEGTIHTWLDGELLPGDAAELGAHVAECSECAAAVAEARGFIAGSSRIVSALDVVPGHVIPITATTPRRRTWYSTTQFRAAAAVLFVAGASMLLVRDGRQARMSAVMDSRATEAASPTSSQGAASAPTQTPRPKESEVARDVHSLKDVTQDAKDEAGSAQAMRAQRKEQSGSAEKRRVSTAGRVMPAPPGAGTATREGAEADSENLSAQASALAAAPPAVTNPAPRLRVNKSNPRSDAPAVVTGVAAAAAPAPAPSPPPLKIVRTDTSGVVVRTTFEVTPGVTVILTDSPTAPAISQMPASTAKSGNAAASQSMALTTRWESITWASAISGRHYLLAGPMTREQLTVLRSRLPQRLR